MKKLPRRNFLNGLLTLAATQIGCRRRQVTSATAFTLGISEDRGTLDPARLVAMDWTPLAQSFETLLTRSADGRRVPVLAERWERLDARTFRFYLRSGVRFHDGSLLDAEACRQSLLRAAAIRRATLPVGIASVGAAGPLAIDVVTERPFAPLLDYLAYINFAIARQAGSQFIGTGPYRLTAYTPLQFARLQRHEMYWRGRAALPHLAFQYIPDAQGRWLALRAGQIQAMRAVPLPETQLAELPSAIRCYRGPGRHVHYLGLNRTYSPWRAELNDVRVRRALRLAIDRQAIVEKILLGAGTAATTILPAWLPGALAPQASGCDPEQARQLLAECGWQAHQRGGWLEKDGRQLRLRYIYSASWLPQNQLLAELLQAQLQAVGIELQLIPMEWSAATQAEQRGEVELRHRGFPVAVGGSHHVLWSSLHSALSARSSVHFHSEQADTLFQAWERAEDESAQTNIAEQLQLAALQDEALIPLFFEQEVFAISAKLRQPGGFTKPHPFTYPLDLMSVTM